MRTLQEWAKYYISSIGYMKKLVFILLSLFCVVSCRQQEKNEFTTQAFEQELKAGKYKETAWCLQGDFGSPKIFLTKTGRAFVLGNKKGTDLRFKHFLTVKASKMICKRFNVQYTDTAQYDTVLKYCTFDDHRNFYETSDTAYWDWVHGYHFADWH